MMKSSARIESPDSCQFSSGSDRPLGAKPQIVSHSSNQGDSPMPEIPAYQRLYGLSRVNRDKKLAKAVEAMQCTFKPQISQRSSLIVKEMRKARVEANDDPFNTQLYVTNDMPPPRETSCRSALKLENRSQRSLKGGTLKESRSLTPNMHSQKLPSPAKQRCGVNEAIIEQMT